MTIDVLINKYKNHALNKGLINNADGNTCWIEFNSEKEFIENHLSYYRTLPDLRDVVLRAADGIFMITRNGNRFLTRHSHQQVYTHRDGNTRGVSLEISGLVGRALITRIDEINSATIFDQIMRIVKECRKPGFGDLAIYDTSLRIAIHKNIEPDKVYLHAGARTGFNVLEQKGYIKYNTANIEYLTKEELPLVFKQNLTCYDAENFACLYKKEFEKLTTI